ncbi:serine/threonine-protein kinase [Petrocella atlantisensis]
MLDMDFAIKFLSPIFSDDPDKDQVRFFQEARMLFELKHESIINVYDVGILKNKPYIRMEYFDGEDLNTVLKKYGVFTLDTATDIILSVCEAMEYAHTKVVHRDLKPSNIMISRPKKCRIIDFGLGIFKENQIYSRLTLVGKGVASGLYTAPELLVDPKIIDKRSDIYSIGAI